ncbi:MAG: OpgC domain-containing protein [Actinomycetota bacterium]|nr:OpgC domain-containing protein [Actinomycetota bacterium]
MVILVVNHIHLDSVLERATSTVVSAAEVLVLVSGVVAGMVYGQRWRTRGAGSTTASLLRRARTLYLTSVAVVALAAALAFVPGLDTDALTAQPAPPALGDASTAQELARAVLAIVTLEAGPWQFSILGFFVAMLAVTPALLWSLHRGLWPAVLASSWALYALGRAWPVDVLPAQSERPFPILVWQLLFVHGLVLGYHRRRLATRLHKARAKLAALAATAALAAVYLQASSSGVDPLGLGALLGHGPGDWARWQAEHLDKTSLDPLRVAVMVSLTAGLYVLLRHRAAAARRAVGWLLLPLGRNSFYVFTMHVFVCLAVASVPWLSGAGIGPVGNAFVQASCIALLWTMARRRFLFRWVPR